MRYAKNVFWEASGWILGLGGFFFHWLGLVGGFSSVGFVLMALVGMMGFVVVTTVTLYFVNSALMLS